MVSLIITNDRDWSRINIIVGFLFYIILLGLSLLLYKMGSGIYNYREHLLLAGEI